MLNEGDDNLEKFFRKAASQYQTDFEERDWEKMEKMLDEQEAQMAPVRFKWWRLVVALLLVGGVTTSLLYVWNDAAEVKPIQGADQEMSSGSTPPADNQNEIATLQGQREDGIKADYQTDTDDQLKKTGTGHDVTTQQDQRAHNDNQDHSGSTSSDRNQRAGSIASTRPDTSDGTSTHLSGNVTTSFDVPEAIDSREERTSAVLAQEQQNAHRVLREARREEQVNNPANGEKQEEHHADDGQLSVTVDTIKKVHDNGEESLDNGVSAIGKSNTPSQPSGSSSTVLSEEDSIKQISAEVDKPDSVATEESTEEDREERVRKNRFSIALSVAPDFSKTTGSNFAGPGDAYGITIGYRIYNKFSISVGALRGYKRYWSYGSDYSPPAGYWVARTNGIIPEKVDGNCVVLEIPLMLSFDIVGTKRTRMFVSAGVSSYLMMSEDYQYSFESPNPGAANGWRTDESTSFPFSTLGLSFGYDYLLTDHLSIGLEPYYKLPLHEVGWGNVNLYSTGVFFVGRYRF